MVNGVSFGNGGPPSMGFESINQANAVLTGQHAGGPTGDTLELSTQQQQHKKSGMNTLLKGALVAGVAVLALRVPFIRNLPIIRNLLKNAPKAAAKAK